MKKRVISAVIMLCVAGVCVFLSPVTRVLFIAAAAVLAGHEMCAALAGAQLAGRVAWIGYVFILGQAALSYFDIPIIYRVALGFAALMAATAAGVFSAEVRGKGTVAALSMLVYPLLPFTLLLDMAAMDCWKPVFALGCFSTWLCDSFALFGGKRFGRHKAAPEVSPNKTVEGCVCGAVASLAAGVIVYYLFRGAHPLSLWLCLLTALVASTAGQLGDLAASLIKRMVGIKDYSNLIPGHGGAMDRVDSLLFAIPTAYFCLFLAGVI